MSSMVEEHKILETMSKTPINEAIAPEQLASALQKTPFVSTPGSMNMRDLGAFAPSYIKPGVIFRSGMLDFLPKDGQSFLRTELRISTIFDFRRADEIRQPRCQIDGIQLFACPYKDGTAVPAPIDLANFVPAQGQALGIGYRYMYQDILDGYSGAFRKAFDAIRTAEPGEAVLFHCTAGKDRTGVMAALILDLMGAPAELIGEEYALTRIGLDPFLEKLLPAALKSLGGAVGADNTHGAAGGYAASLDMSSPGVKAFLSTSALIMVDFVDNVRKKYGGVEGYLKRVLEFTDLELAEIRAKLKPEQAE